MRLAVAVPFLVVACSATDPSAPIPRSPARAPAAVLRCVAKVRNRPSVTCSRASITRRNLRADVIVGRKNYDVTLNFSGVTFTSGTGVFSAGVSVTNLMNQALGTTDGTTSSASGTRVFFTSGPSLAAGQGIITLSNPDGVGTFTASGQPYFQYATLIQPSATSSARTWNFELGDSVNAFAFTLEVDAPMPAEGSIRHWTTIRQGLQSNALTGMWQDTPSDIWAVGVSNTFLRNTGSGWAIVTPTGYTGSFDFQAIFGASSTDYWAVANGGHMVHYNGTTWASSTSLLTTRNLHGVWGSSTTNYITVGDSLTIDQYNGLLWTPMVPPLGVATATDLRGIWGNDGTHIFAVGDNGTVIFYNGLIWAAQTSNTTQNLLAVWGTSATNVYAVGANGVIIHYNGTAWATMTSPTANNLNALGGSGASDIWAVGDAGTTVHYNGTSWSASTSVTGISLTGVVSGYAVGAYGALMTYSSGWTLSNQSGVPVNAIWADSPTDVWVASYGTMLHYDGTSWTSTYVGAKEMTYGLWGFASGPTLYAAGGSGTMSIYSGGSWAATSTAQPGYRATWGSAASNVYAAGTSGDITQYNGSSWTNQSALTTVSVFGLWGTSATNIYAAADSGRLFQYNGTSWNAITTGTTQALNAVSGSSATDVWVAGASGTMLHYNGSSWSPATSGTSVALHGVWADTPPGSYTADVYAVGDNGTVQHGNGSVILAMPTTVTSPLRTVFGTSSTNVYVGGDVGVVLWGTQ
jgi:hypothetical protein